MVELIEVVIGTLLCTTMTVLNWTILIVGCWIIWAVYKIGWFWSLLIKEIGFSNETSAQEKSKDNNEVSEVFYLSKLVTKIANMGQWVSFR